MTTERGCHLYYVTQKDVLLRETYPAAPGPHERLSVCIVRVDWPESTSWSLHLCHFVTDLLLKELHKPLSLAHHLTAWFC
ncbi:hypothetical protein DPEC_G00168680 [Dallia pectoralis]|uniref:Uncharacterized protein n=1 Tax=Dallia pectoralis TaxID=75939 RepID=A0ACC2GCU8_DALPE|nr:hypothetical protein DPEC_G00168680 [Dallia pectoralis]